MPQPTEANVMKMDDVLALIQTMNEANQKNLVTAIQELKKPSEFEQEKLDKERAILARKRAERLNLGAAQEQSRLMKMLTCGHQRPDGQHVWGAQANSNNTFTPMCGQCQSQLPKIPVTPDQIQNGVNLNAYKGLTMGALLEWHKRSYKSDCGNPDCMACHPERINSMREELQTRMLAAQRLTQQPVAV